MHRNEPVSAIDQLKAQARCLQRAVEAHEPAAVQRVRRHPELAALEGPALVEQVQRRHCLHLVARDHGFRDWPHARAVLLAPMQVEDFGSLLYPDGASAHWNIWSASYDEARQIRSDHGGFLLAYRHQFLIVDAHFIDTLGLSPEDPDWTAIERDWVRPRDPDARARLYAKLIRARSQAA